MAVGRKIDRTEKLNYAVIPTGPNKPMEPIHDRTPAILNEREFKAWLDPKADIETLKSLLIPCPDDLLVAHPNISPHKSSCERHTIFA